MSKDKEKKTEDDSDLLSLIDSLLDSNADDALEIKSTEKVEILDQLAESVLGELSTEPTDSNLQIPKYDLEKKAFEVYNVSESSGIKESKKTIPSSYKIKFSSYKTLKSIQKDKNTNLTCPKCNYIFESLETEDIICPKCHHVFNL